MPKPSERIREIFDEIMSEERDDIRAMQAHDVAIIQYLDEEAEKKRSPITIIEKQEQTAVCDCDGEPHGREDSCNNK